MFIDIIKFNLTTRRSEMKKAISLIMSFALVFAFWGIAVGSSGAPKEPKVEKKTDTVTTTAKGAKTASIVEAKCAKCHKGDKDVKKVNEAKGIKNTDEMVKLIRKGTKAELHKKISDKDLKAAGKELFAEKKVVEPKKKEEVKTETKKTEDVKKKNDVKTETEKAQEKPKKKKPEGC